MNENVRQLWAPWRVGYIVGPKPTGCVFCAKATATPADDAANLVLARGRECFVMMNIYPYNPGHLLVLPYVHVGELEEMSETARVELWDLVLVWKQRLQAVMHAQGFNIGVNLGHVAGAGITEHVHVHVVPRWNGDTNFMSVVGDVRIVSQSLQDLYEQLKDHC
ncbi:MAG: HIT domain-containing protein [bacterium]|nr:HIT domain-containing protein [bacterium]